MSIAAPERSIRILTNHQGQEASPSWRAVSTCMPPRGNGLVASVKAALRLFLKRGDFDCVVVGAGRSDLLFCLMQSLLPFRKVSCVMIDCLWAREKNPARHALKKILFRLANRSVDRFVVWARHEQDAFSRTYGLPGEKFIFVPYHTTIETRDLKPGPGDYLFSGGDSNRDYATLMEAVRDLPVRLVIASVMLQARMPGPYPGNVAVQGFSHEEYMMKLAGCRMNIVALDGEELRSAGQQTFLNSMLLGKPTIVTDLDGPAGYIRHGVDGLLVPPGDAAALRKAIVSLLQDPAAERQMGINGAAAAARYSTEEHFKKIIAVAEAVVRRKKEGRTEHG